MRVLGCALVSQGCSDEAQQIQDSKPEAPQNKSIEQHKFNRSQFGRAEVQMERRADQVSEEHLEEESVLVSCFCRFLDILVILWIPLHLSRVPLSSSCCFPICVLGSNFLPVILHQWDQLDVVAHMFNPSTQETAGSLSLVCKANSRARQRNPTQQTNKQTSKWILMGFDVHPTSLCLNLDYVQGDFICK